MLPKFLSNINFKKRITKWWSRRGNRGLPTWYFNGFLTLFLGYIMYFPLGLLGYVGMKSISDIILSENLFSISSLSYLLFFVGITCFNFTIHYFILAYFRKRTAFTFKTKLNLRARILNRHRFSDLFFYASMIFAIIAIVMLGTFLQIEYLNYIPTYSESEILKEMIGFFHPIFQEYFPFVLTYFVLFYLFSIFTGSGLKPQKRLIYIADSLEKFKTTKWKKNDEKLHEDEYLVSKFVTTFNNVLLYSMDVIDEVDLNSKLSCIILARNMGTDEEKELVKSSLSNLKGLLKSKSWKSQLIDWLICLESVFPRFNNFKNDIIIKSKRSKRRINLRDNVQFIIAVGALVVALIELALYLIHY